MTKFAQFASLLAIVFLMLPIAAQAQASRTFVSGVGDDANPCSRTAPCKTFAGAISKTSASGEINVLDPGGFGALTITKAITISSDGIGTAGVLVAGGNGITVAAGANDVVVLKDLDIDGLGPTAPGSAAGIQFNSGAQLIVKNCRIYGFQAATGAGSGINFQPSAASKLYVYDSVISNNGSTGGPIGASGNVLIQPQSGGSVTAQFENVRLINGFNFGLRADGTISGAGTTNVVLQNVIADGSTNAGFVAATAATSGAIVNLFLNTVTASNNGGYGIHSVGSNATIRLTGTTVTNNNIGLGTGSSGVLASYSNNNVSGNATDGAPTTTILPK